MRISNEPTHQITNSQNQKSKDNAQNAPFVLGDHATNNNNGGETPRNEEHALRSTVATAVQNTLARLYETGSVFNAKDAKVMNVSDISAADRQRYTEIVVDAAENGGFSNAKNYIASLSTEDFALLMRVNGVATEIRIGANGAATSVKVTDINEEGALNLLLPESEHVDIDNNSWLSVGNGATLIFPPTNAPDSVKHAWKKQQKICPIVTQGRP